MSSPHLPRPVLYGLASCGGGRLGHVRNFEPVRFRRLTAGGGGGGGNRWVAIDAAAALAYFWLFQSVQLSKSAQEKRIQWERERGKVSDDMTVKLLCRKKTLKLK